MKNSVRRVIVLLLGFALLAAACGDDDTTTTQAAAPPVTEAPASTEAPTTTAAPATTVASTTTQAATEAQAPLGVFDVPRITAEELNDRLDDGEEIVVLDTRDSFLHARGHIPGAIVETAADFDLIPHDQEIVLYCA